jgi:beta-glucanase (GH16 family)
LAVAGLAGVSRAALLDDAGPAVAADSGPAHADGSYSPSGVSFGVPDTVAGAGVEQGAVRLAPGVGSVSFGDDASFRLSTTAAARWLVMVDVRVDASSGYPLIISKGDRTTNGFALFYDPARRAVGFVINGYQYAEADVPLSTMADLALSWDGATLTLYLNGRAVMQQFDVSPQTVTDTDALMVGGTGGITVAKLVVATDANTVAIPQVYAALSSTALAQVAPPPTPGPAANGATLLWSDEFNGPAGSDVNSGDWVTEVGAPTNDGRLEYDSVGTANKQLDGNGHLVITARRENVGGRSYTSARIEGTHPFTTGYAEFMAKMPVWPGMMPATWFYGAAASTYPTVGDYSANTSFAEIDIPEVQTGGSEADPDRANLTVHGDFAHDQTFSDRWQLGWDQNKADFSPQRVGDSWHRFGVYINPADDSVTIYIDGVPTYRYARADANARYAQLSPQQDAVWPYGTTPLIPIIEIEIGGYSGTPEQSANADTLQVDYYRVYDKPPY